MATKTKVSLAERVRNLIGLRSELDTIIAKQKMERRPVEDAIVLASEAIKGEMKRSKMQSFRTEWGTPYFAIRHTPIVANEGKVISWLTKKGLTEYIASRLTDSFYEKFLHDESTKLIKIEGIEIKEVESFGVRKPEENHGNKTNNK